MFKTKTPKSIEQITSGFNSMVADLELLAAKNSDKLGENATAIAKLQAENEQLEEEISEAVGLISRILALVKG